MTIQTQRVIRLLIVNERREIVESISRFVGQFPHVDVVGTAHSLEDSVRCARELQPGAVLCDYQRLKAETLERIRRLRKELPDACIIAMSYDDDRAEEVLGAGADQFIAKFDLGQQLLPALDRCGKR
jgi:DNA-binding NarL/FixJ family response regulator